MIELRRAVSNLSIDKHPFFFSFDGNQVSALSLAGALINFPSFSPLWKYVPRFIEGRILTFCKIKTTSKNWLSNSHNAWNQNVHNFYNKSNNSDNNDINKNAFDMIMMMIIRLILITTTNCSNDVDMVMMTTSAMMMVMRMMVIIMIKYFLFSVIWYIFLYLGVWHNYLTEMSLWVQHYFYFWKRCSERKVSSRSKC